jgi:hypothetical protein
VAIPGAALLHVAGCSPSTTRSFRHPGPARARSGRAGPGRDPCTSKLAPGSDLSRDGSATDAWHDHRGCELVRGAWVPALTRIGPEGPYGAAMTSVDGRCGAAYRAVARGRGSPSTKPSFRHPGAARSRSGRAGRDPCTLKLAPGSDRSRERCATDGRHEPGTCALLQGAWVPALTRMGPAVPYGAAMMSVAERCGAAYRGQIAPASTGASSCIVWEVGEDG